MALGAEARAANASMSKRLKSSPVGHQRSIPEKVSKNEKRKSDANTTQASSTEGIGGGAGVASQEATAYAPMTVSDDRPSTSAAARRDLQRQPPPPTAPVEFDADNPLDEANISDDEEGGTRIGDIYIPPPIPAYCSTESKGPRLIIKLIENNNFKSYAGKVVLGPFHHCFTAIIGPNGSGKSNVIDSMLFVFGYRANKIRCKKICTLLHNSAKYPNTGSCSVAVHFRQVIDCPDGTCEDVPGSEIVVERTAFRDNSSYYTINGKRVQFKEVAKLLKKHNVDLDHNRFLILQGEVESIAMMKAKGPSENECGMLEYLEDIVGTTRYKAPLVKINARVEQLTEERTERHNRCKLAEREMKDLELPYNEAVDYLRLENDNTRTKNLRIQKYLSEKKKKLQEYEQDQESIKSQLKAHDEENTKIVEDREAKEKLIREETLHFEKLRKTKEEAEKKHEQAMKNFTDVQQTMALANKRRKQNKVDQEKCEKQLSDLRKVPEKNEREIFDCVKKVERLNKEKSQKEEELQVNYDTLEKQTKPLIEERDQLETELVDLTKNVDEAKSQVTLAESELKILKHDETAEARKYQSLKTSYEESEKTLGEKKAEMEKLNALLPETEKEIKVKQAELKNHQQKEEESREELMALKAEIHEKMNCMQASRSNKVLNSLMQQKHEGNIPGILGRLGDLGAIDAKYDVAISTACGRLDNIVVDTVNTAQNCIEYLKANDVGRASFIALEKVQHLANQSYRIQTPENAARLYDLVQVEDERVLPVFYFSLRNTLVAADLEQATRIAYGAQRYRVVTLTGDVIETSGTMSGGGRTQIRGKMGTKVQTKTSAADDTSFVTQKALEKMQVQAEQLQSKVNYCQEQQGHLEREIRLLEHNLQSYKPTIKKVAISIKSLEESLPLIFKQLQAQKTRMEQSVTDRAKVNALEQDIEKKKEAYQNADKATDKIREKIDAIKTQIDNIHGEKVKSVQTKIKSITTQIKKLEANVAKLKADISGTERNIKKIENQIQQLGEDILKAQDEITELSKQRQIHDDETVEYSKAVEDAQKEIEKFEGATSGVHQEVLELQKRESDLKIKRVEIEQKLQTTHSKLTDVKNQIPHWQNQLKPLRLHDIPGETDPEPPLKTYTDEELQAYTLQDIQYKESVQEETLKKKPNLTVIPEYLERRDIYLDRVKMLEDITSKRNEMRQLYDDVRKKRYNEFMQGFHIITRKLKEMYQMITQGGDAELELVDSMDPFTEGVQFSVRPPKKSWKNISNLSGGEKTLSSLALVFALHYYKPSPLYFMDEIDAALDFKNISIVSHYIKERTKNAQFIIISLRSNMFELCDHIVGIYKVKDCTDAIVIKNVAPPQPVLAEKPYMVPHSHLNLADEDSMISNNYDDNLQMPPPPLPRRRDLTFTPTIDSTALSEVIQPNLNSTNTSPPKTLAMDKSAVTSINDDIFKKPPPRHVPSAAI